MELNKQVNEQIIIYSSEDGQTQVDVRLVNETVWLTRQQIATLFGRDYKTVSKHINNALKEELEGLEVVAKFANTTLHGAIEGKTQTHEIDYFNLDVIMSVGYRVKSKRGVQFRQWANKVLKQYLINVVKDLLKLTNPYLSTSLQKVWRNTKPQRVGASSKISCRYLPNYD